MCLNIFKDCTNGVRYGKTIDTCMDGLVHRWRYNWHGWKIIPVKTQTSIRPLDVRLQIEFRTLLIITFIHHFPRYFLNSFTTLIFNWICLHWLHSTKSGSSYLFISELSHEGIAGRYLGSTIGIYQINFWKWHVCVSRAGFVPGFLSECLLEFDTLSSTLSHHGWMNFLN